MRKVITLILMLCIMASSATTFAAGSVVDPNKLTYLSNAMDSYETGTQMIERMRVLSDKVSAGERLSEVEIELFVRYFKLYHEFSTLSTLERAMVTSPDKLDDMSQIMIDSETFSVSILEGYYKDYKSGKKDYDTFISLMAGLSGALIESYDAVNKQ